MTNPPPLPTSSQPDMFPSQTSPHQEAVLSPYARSTLRRALNILERQLREPGTAFTSASATRDWLRLQLAGEEREVFMVLFLDNQNRLIAHEILFTGTVSHTEVHPRKVVKAALKHNAAPSSLPTIIRQAWRSPARLTGDSRNVLNRCWTWWISAFWIIWWWVPWRLPPLLKEAGYDLRGKQQHENHPQTPGDGNIPPASPFPAVSFLHREIRLVRQHLSLRREGGTGYQRRPGRVR